MLSTADPHVQFVSTRDLQINLLAVQVFIYVAITVVVNAIADLHAIPLREGSATPGERFANAHAVIA